MRRPEIVKRIQETVHQAEPSATIILYGSEARGDVDFLVRCMNWN